MSFLGKTLLNSYVLIACVLLICASLCGPFEAFRADDPCESLQEPLSFEEQEIAVRAYLEHSGKSSERAAVQKACEAVVLHRVRMVAR